MANVSTEHPHHREMARHWALPRALYAGTPAMRDAGEAFLPRHRRETTEGWKYRLDRSFLSGYFEDAIHNISQKPFAAPVVVNEEDDQGQGGSEPIISEWAQDVDLEGTQLTGFAERVFRNGLIDGIAHILVDFSKSGAPRETLAQRAQSRARPWFSEVPALKLIDWREDEDNRRLSRITIQEEVLVPEGDWELIKVKQWRVWYPDRWELYRVGNATDEMSIVEAGPNPLGFIPLVTIYFNRIGFMEARPTLERLAWLELQHWQSRSDQNNILAVARCPAIHFRGFDISKETPSWGPNAAFYSTDPASAVEIVEHSGAAVEAGRQDLLDIEARMRAMTASTLTAAPGDVKATAHALDAASAKSWIAAMAQVTEFAFEQCFKIALAWTGNQSGRVDLTVNSEFQLPSEGDEAMVMALRAGGDLSRKTVLEEAKRRGKLDDRLDIEEELKRVEEEISGLDFGVSVGGEDVEPGTTDDGDEPDALAA